jgi:RNA recognition motif-containing protein
MFRFAYVDFASPDHKVIAVTLSERDFQGRRLLIKDGKSSCRYVPNIYFDDCTLGDDFTGRPAAVKEENLDKADLDDKTRSVKAGSTGLSKTAQKILRVQKQPPAPTLFLGNLGFETTDKSIRELFEAHRGLQTKIKTELDEGEKKDEAKVKDKWIRKIRMGTFEDTGNCKGFVSAPLAHLFVFLIQPVQVGVCRFYKYRTCDSGVGQYQKPSPRWPKSGC